MSYLDHLEGGTDSPPVDKLPPNIYRRYIPNPRSTPLVSGEYYHVYNRGVALQPVFLNKRDYRQLLFDLSYYRFTKPPVKLSKFKELSLDQRLYLLSELKRKDEKLVEIISFALMPNHFHLLLKQCVNKGISTFLSRVTNSYTKFFNTKNERVGPVFQGVFKSVHISTTEQLIHVSRYIHINPTVSFVINREELFSYPWTSLPNYFHNPDFVNPVPVLSNFSSPEDYKKFILDQIDYGKRLEEIKHLALE